MAISADGFIAGPDDDVDWVGEESWESYLGFVKGCDVILVGKNTYSLMQKDEFVSGTKYFVVTNDPDFDSGNYEKISIESIADIPRAEKIGVIGGGELNGSLTSLGVIDEIILDIEPIVLGQGKRLFGSYEGKMNLELQSSKTIGQSTTQNQYKVVQLGQA